MKYEFAFNVYVVPTFTLVGIVNVTDEASFTTTLFVSHLYCTFFTLSAGVADITILSPAFADTVAPFFISALFNVTFKSFDFTVSSSVGYTNVYFCQPVFVIVLGEPSSFVATGSTYKSI